MMKPHSHLTRQVFRALVAERPYHASGCLQLLRPSQSRRKSPNLQPSSRRNIFGISLGGTKESYQGSKATPQNIEAALLKLVDLLRARRSRTRIPEDAEVLDAFKFLFQVRSELPKGLTRNEVYLATETLDHLLQRKLVLNPEEPAGLERDDLQNVLIALATANGSKAFKSDSRALANAVFDVLRFSLDAANIDAEQPSAPLSNTYVQVLAQTGSALDALATLRGLGRSSNDTHQLWTATLQGLLSEGRTAEFWEALQERQSRLGALDAQAHEALVIAFAGKGDAENAKTMFRTPVQDGHIPTTPCLTGMLDVCITTTDQDLGDECANALRARSDLGDATGVLLMWYASQNPSLEAMKDHITDLADNGATDVVTMKTFNRLVAYAYDRRDSVLAQKYIRLAESFGLPPDAATFALQLEYEVFRGDMAAAADTFEAMVIEDVPQERPDVAALNHFLTKLCFAPEPNHELISRVIDRVLETGADLEAETLAGLCSVFLRRDDLEEAAGLLRFRVDAFPRADRARIAAVFKQFICDPDIKDQRAYNAYDLFRVAFPETEPAERVPLMKSFFDRKRPDLGVLVFGHMRQLDGPEGRPTAEVYAECYHGIANCQDVDGLQLVHNMLKLDLEVEPSTRIRNGLMAACTACRMPFSSIIDHYWKILGSREGPTLSTFVLALRACETWVPQGSYEARKVMGMMQKWNLIVTKELYDAYIGAMAGQSQFENTVELIERMEEDIGEAPDVLTIGTFYNAIPWQWRKDEVEKWAKAVYPELWEELVSYGEVIDEEWEVRYFNIDRDVDVNDDLLFEDGAYSAELATTSVPSIEQPKQ